VVRAIRWTLGALGAVLLLGGGASIFWRPTHEVLYTPSRAPIVCQPSGCTALYRLELGNTGRAGQPHVRLRLRSDVLDTASLPPRVRDFGKFERPAAVSDAGGVRTFDVPSLEPDQRVELSFVLQRPEPAAFPAWGDVLVGIEAAHGTARVGNPALTALLRVWYRIAAIF
jgi:hypothetical protein